MFCTFQDGAFTACFGNIEFSPTVFQTAESLTDDQQVEFNVYRVVDEYPELAPDSRHIEQWDYRIDGRTVIRTWGQAPIPEEERAQRLAGKVDQLWRAADAYVGGYISGMAIGLLAISVIQQKPKALSVAVWSSSVWDVYYQRKAAATYDGAVDTDFSACGPIPHSVPELRAELGL